MNNDQKKDEDSEELEQEEERSEGFIEGSQELEFNNVAGEKFDDEEGFSEESQEIEKGL